MSTFESTPPIQDGLRVPPNASLASAIGSAHSLKSAVADIVDNSIDASADRVHIRLIVRDKAKYGTIEILGLAIYDNGTGMSPDQLQSAMEYGMRRDREHTELAHYGVGLKAASMSQAEILEVYSRRLGASAAGRRLTSETVGSAEGPLVETIDPDYSENVLGSIAELDFDLGHGTAVVWKQPRNFSTSTDPDEVRASLKDAFYTLSMHLGLVHHRAIASERVRITLDEFDPDLEFAGPLHEVRALDPFGYSRSGSSQFPIRFAASVEGIDFTVIAHLWPAEETSTDPFLLGTGDGVVRQGFYIYRNDRLLQHGGWNTMWENDDPSRKLLRVSFELTEGLEKFVRMNPEKEGIELRAPIREALLNARSIDGRTRLEDAINLANMASAESRKRPRKPLPPIARPKRGLPRSVIDAMESAFGFDDSAPPVKIVWAPLSESKVFDFFLESREIRLNTRYHAQLTRVEGPASSGQAPLLVTLIFMLLRSDLLRVNTNKQWQQEQAAIQEVVLAALEAQTAWEAKVQR